jgi:hypothetical protein
LRQPPLSRVVTQVLLPSSHYSRSLFSKNSKVDINWGWNQSTFFSAQSLVHSFLFPTLFLVPTTRSLSTSRYSTAPLGSANNTHNPLYSTCLCTHSVKPMAQVMARQVLGLSAPSSRQDIVSALLNDYGCSFEHDDASPSAFSPVRADKELPSPPGSSNSMKNKPLPAVQRAEQRMSTKFQLRGKHTFLFFACL